MNKKQQIVLLLGLLLMMLNGLFPPFEAEEKATAKDETTTTTYLGYHIVFSHPSPVDVLGKNYNKWMNDLVANAQNEQVKDAAVVEYFKRLNAVTVRVAMSVFIVQFVTIVSVTVGTCFLFQRSNVLGETK
jgi:hypothetical protein